MAILSTEAQNQLAEFMPLNELNHIQSNNYLIELTPAVNSVQLNLGDFSYAA